jgi:hypothetical protein
MQMSQVGRDQAVEKDGPALQGAIQGAAAQKREIEAKEAVRRAEESKDGPGPVKERGGSRRERASKEGGAEAEPGESEDEGGEEVVRDPSLGNRVDLSG